MERYDAGFNGQQMRHQRVCLRKTVLVHQTAAGKDGRYRDDTVLQFFIRRHRKPFFRHVLSADSSGCLFTDFHLDPEGFPGLRITGKFHRVQPIIVDRSHMKRQTVDQCESDTDDGHDQEKSPQQGIA